MQSNLVYPEATIRFVQLSRKNLMPSEHAILRASTEAWHCVMTDDLHNPSFSLLCLNPGHPSHSTGHGQNATPFHLPSAQRGSRGQG
jgi:hypothetical protein